jgi:hypothetical protein
VRRHLLDLVVLLVLSTLAAGGLLLVDPSIRSVTLHVYVLVLGALAMLALVAAAGDAVPRQRRSQLEAALAAAPRREQAVHELERAQRDVTLACSSAYDLHVRLLPQLREIAEARLERSGRRAGPDTLGRWWELLRPDRELPEDRFGPGIRIDELRALLAELETL